ncbi:MAG: oligosaccharide flippase family protein [Acidobacteriia bacterium]|nr:oligosaccharide flippase family protein [Terriglobia bacterium]
MALLDQGLISASNFVIAVLLARQLSANDYGAYALAFEGLLFLSVLYGALVLEPMSVFGPSIYQDQLSEYLGTLLKIHIGASIVATSGVLALAGVLRWLHRGGNLPAALVGVGFAVPCLLLFWLARRAFYIKLSPGNAALGALTYSAVLLTGLLVVTWRGGLSPLLAFLIMGLAAAITGVGMLVRLKPTRRLSAQTFSLKEVLKRHWAYGRWAVASSVAIWCSTALLYPLVGVFGGLAAVGGFKALMNLASPVGQAFVAVSLLSLPHASQVFHEAGSAGSERLRLRLSLLYAGGPALYWVLVCFLREPILRHLYAGKYLAMGGLVTWVALGSTLRIAATAQAIVLRSMQSPHVVFWAYLIGGMTTLLAGIPLTSIWGLRGAVMTLTISSGMALAVAYMLARHGFSPELAPKSSASSEIAA